jgi:hypothetical protein
MGLQHKNSWNGKRNTQQEDHFWQTVNLVIKNSQASTRLLLQIIYIINQVQSSNLPLIIETINSILSLARRQRGF